MNEYRNQEWEEHDGERGAICPKEEQTELVPLQESEKGENASERKNKPLWALAALLLAIAVAGTALSLLFFRKDEEARESPTITDELSYGGIFESAEVARRCVEASVSLRLGAPDELGGESVSGVIISEDGWILSGAPAFKGERGRIYARLWSGRDIPVEEVRYDGEGRLTLYRIAEEGLSAAKLGDSALIQGEELIALSSCGAPDYACALLSGVMSHPDRSVRIEQEGGGVLLDGLLQVDLSLGDNGCGTPLFDKKGNLVGISLRENMNYFTGIEKISSFVDKID